MLKLVILIVALSASVSFAAEAKKDAPASEASSKEEKKETYIPTDLDDCYRELDKNLRADDIEKIRKGEIQAIDMHFGLGMGLRNGWGLWGGSRLAKYFNAMGIFHPDDMSGIILESYVRQLRKEPIRLDEQVAYYKKYWEEAKKRDEAEKKEKKKG